ncbi:MAG: DNA repair protein RecO [Parvularculaceae bacterium]|nr:DNA repair protein RecO [Parvularculaceae bacterium]
MEFVDDGIVLAARAHGESAAIAEILTSHHGRWAGLVYGGQGRTKTPLLQPGNGVKATWKGRLDDSLGFFTLELAQARAASLMQDRLSLAALTAACAVASASIPERQPHPRLYHTLRILFDHLDNVDIWPALMARWEIGLLAELGFGLTLDACAATGARENLIYVSPKSACAVSAESGEPYKDRMLPLPAFLRDASADATLTDAINGLRTTGHFIETRILHAANQEMPEARRRLAEALGALALAAASAMPRP